MIEIICWINDGDDIDQLTLKLNANRYKKVCIKSNKTTFPDYTLFGCHLLEMIRFDCPNIETIGKHFLGLCNSLSIVDLTGMPKLKYIGEYCLAECGNKKKYIDISNLEQLSVIGKAFLGVSGRVTIYAKNLKKIKRIPYLLYRTTLEDVSLDTSFNEIWMKNTQIKKVYNEKIDIVIKFLCIGTKIDEFKHKPTVLNKIISFIL